MYMTVTASRGLTAEQGERVEAFLSELLPRLKQEPGVKEILHGSSPDGHDAITIIVWGSADDAKRYRESALIREPMVLEQELGLASTRDGFAVSTHLS
jgi:heme-degrading monooxygenase HmoA